MKREIGKILLPKEGLCLRYNIIGGKETGYGLEVTMTKDGAVTRERCESLTDSPAEIRRFGRAVAAGTVLPGFLKEIAEEWEF